MSPDDERRQAADAAPCDFEQCDSGELEPARTDPTASGIAARAHGQRILGHNRPIRPSESTEPPAHTS